VGDRVFPQINEKTKEHPNDYRIVNSVPMASPGKLFLNRAFNTPFLP
jgi:hypothetical protein